MAKKQPYEFDRGQFVKRIAFSFCAFASAVGLIAIVGLLIVFKPDLGLG